MSAESPRLLILETSGRVGQVAVAQGDILLAERRLDEVRRHARDLAPAVAELLAGQAWRPADLEGIVVSRGPGSYTGLRVGIMSAKAFAYATGCALLAVETFAAIASQAPPDVLRLDVLADAQQEKVYVQRFERQAEWVSLQPVRILALQAWLAELESEVVVTGPAVRVYQKHFPAGCRVLPDEVAEPQPASLLRLGLARFRAGTRDDLWSVEPLYLRPSSAEEKLRDRPPS